MTQINSNLIKKYVNGTILYENPTGTSGNITLSDNVNNYKYIEITWGVDGTTQQTRETIKYNVTNDMHVMYIRPYITNVLYLYSTQLSITGASVTVEKYSRGQYNNQSLDINFNYIYKIVGYK